MSSPHHNAHPTSGGHHSGYCPHLDSWLGLLGTQAMTGRHMAANAGCPNQSGRK